MEEAARKPPWFSIDAPQDAVQIRPTESVLRKPPWTEEIEQELLRLHATGTMSNQQMATSLNKKFNSSLTRNAVIGKLSRMVGKDTSLLRRTVKKRSPPTGRKAVVHVVPSARLPVAPTFGRSRLPTAAGLPEMTGEVTELSKSLVELTEWDCRWPLGHVHDHPPYMFCGFPVLEGQPYCSHHATKATRERKP